MTTETKAWQVAFGKICNEKYRNQMEEIFEFIDDVGKRLTRPIKDLDDIRIAMKALSEVRENEIRIDMEIGPIEVWFTLSSITIICQNTMMSCYCAMHCDF